MADHACEQHAACGNEVLLPTGDGPVSLPFLPYTPAPAAYKRPLLLQCISTGRRLSCGPPGAHVGNPGTQRAAFVFADCPVNPPPPRPAGHARRCRRSAAPSFRTGRLARTTTARTNLRSGAHPLSPVKLNVHAGMLVCESRLCRLPRLLLCMPLASCPCSAGTLASLPPHAAWLLQGVRRRRGGGGRFQLMCHAEPRHAQMQLSLPPPASLTNGWRRTRAAVWVTPCRAQPMCTASPCPPCTLPLYRHRTVSSAVSSPTCCVAPHRSSLDLPTPGVRFHHRPAPSLLPAFPVQPHSVDSPVSHARSGRAATI